MIAKTFRRSSSTISTLLPLSPACGPGWAAGGGRSPVRACPRRLAVAPAWPLTVPCGRAEAASWPFPAVPFSVRRDRGRRAAGGVPVAAPGHRGHAGSAGAG